MTDDEMQVLITKARRIAGYRGPGHSYWGMIFGAEALLGGERSLLSREIIETMLIEAVGTTGTGREPADRLKSILRRSVPQYPRPLSVRSGNESVSPAEHGNS